MKIKSVSYKSALLSSNKLDQKSLDLMPLTGYCQVHSSDLYGLRVNISREWSAVQGNSFRISWNTLTAHWDGHK